MNGSEMFFPGRFFILLLHCLNSHPMGIPGVINIIPDNMLKPCVKKWGFSLVYKKIGCIFVSSGER
jgi:hypothetical protein